MCLVTGTAKIGTPAKEPGAGGWDPEGKRRHPCGPEQGMGIWEERGGTRGPMQKGNPGRKRRSQEGGPGQEVWESGGKGEAPKKEV